MQNYVQHGRIATVTAPYAVSSGGGVKVGNLFGVAVNTYALNDSAEIVRKGVFDLAKDTSTFATGDTVYWDDTAKKATSTATGNMLIGVADITTADGTNALGGSSGDATVRVVLINQQGSVPPPQGPAGALGVAYARYDFSVDGGAQGAITPATNTTIPANAILIGGVINSTTAVTSGGSATVAIGTAAGSAANSILHATGKASFTLDALLDPVMQFTAATAVKMSAAGKITVTVATADLTAGVLEIFVYYVVPKNA